MSLDVCKHRRSLNLDCQWCDDEKAIEAERDRLKEELEKNQATYYQMSEWGRKEIDRLKAEIHTLSCPICGSDVNGTNWKAKAEKMAEALRFMLKEAELMNAYFEDQKEVVLHYNDIRPWIESIPTAKSALEEVDK